MHGRGRVELQWWGSDIGQFAASELADYVKSMTGTRIHTSRVPAPSDKPGTAHSGIFLARGHVDRTKRARWISTANEKLDSKPDDTYIIQSAAGHVVLTGAGERGTLNAVYSLLEQLGVHFFAPEFAFYQGNSERVPRKSRCVVRAQSTLVEPKWPIRRKDVEEGFSLSKGHIVALVDWMAKHKLNYLVFPYDYYAIGVTRYDDFREVLAPELAKRGIKMEVGGHGYDSFLPPEKYPQFYTSDASVFDVQNQDAVDTYVSNVVDYLADRPEIATFDCWPPDGGTWPKAALSKYGTATNAETVVVNALVAALKKAGISTRVERIAYAAALEPPTGSYEFDPDVLIDFAAIGRTYTVPFGDPSNETNAKFAKLLKKWIFLHQGDVAIYDYSRRYRWRGLGNPIDVIAADAAYYHKVGAQGTESYAEAGNWLQFEAEHLFTAQSAWNPTLSADEFRSDYLPARFGRGAHDVARYLGHTSADPDQLGADGGGTKFRRQYRAALSDIVAAQHAVGRNRSAQNILGLLKSGVHLSLADIDITYEADNPKRLERAQRRYRVLTEKYRFSGIQLECTYQTKRYGFTLGREETAQRYRSPAWGYLREWSLTCRAGESTPLVVVAQPVDFDRHRIRWELDLPDAITSSRASGRLDIIGSRAEHAPCRITVGPNVPAGTYTIGVTFYEVGDRNGGTKLGTDEATLTVV
ncbi:DUF4838 domain-containing protein [Spelaeicoccus albus]|uniref:DUF4838 domain-containing protein n=1 Tax=Spelaeicoccus albus TaxID=1280376 RepID=A0A7Z0D092_9MICO|nr:DUF4838 domain-containing protein [Spelaeicoccus albus]NYI67074.1 hypothetical protein [Spelaeicoccus albus]